MCEAVVTVTRRVRHEVQPRVKHRGVEPKGGEALALVQWYAIWTHSHFEQVARDQLSAKGFQSFLPIVQTWSRRAGLQRRIRRPMFPGYLFIRLNMDKSRYIEVLKTKGVVRILGGRWDQLTPVADEEIEALERVIASNLMVLPHAYLREGQRVRIDTGPLAGVEGILVRSRPKRGLLVLSVDLLHQSVAVEVDCTTVVPSGGPWETRTATEVRLKADTTGTLSSSVVSWL
jgi:transcriptional antiterminator NusG